MGSSWISSWQRIFQLRFRGASSAEAMEDGLPFLVPDTDLKAPLPKDDVEDIAAWFDQFGPTDPSYLRAHYERFRSTRDFALAPVGGGVRLRILDIGAHWLHNAYFYAERGHSVVCMDAPDTLRVPAVIAAARSMGAGIVPNRRMEKADGFARLADDSIDLVLFCEIIEHLAFNPIPFWKQVYRVLKPGGRIIVTTPNSFYWRALEERLARIMEGRGYGLAVEEILTYGTYGHHWKEFTISELQEYFRFLSSDFDTSRFEMVTNPEDAAVTLSGALAAIGERIDVRAHNIYLDVVLPAKIRGIEISPPWEPS